MRQTAHASALLIGARAILIRGDSGAGKSRLCLAALAAATTLPSGFGRLIGDDRVILQPAHGRLVARAVPELAGMIEVRGLGVRRVAFEAAGVVGLVVDLGAPMGERVPCEAAQITTVSGISLPRLAVPAAVEPLPMLIAALRTAEFRV